jgi:AraC-like DNA-binding protein
VTALAARRFSAHSFPGASGVLLGRVADEDRLYRGMKDRFAYVVGARGATEFLYRGGVYQSGPDALRVQQPGEMYRELKRDGLLTYDVVILDLAQVDAARGALGKRELVLASPVLAIGHAQARPLLALHAALVQETAQLALESAIAEAAMAFVELGARQSETVGRERPAVRKARAYLLEHLAEPVRLDDLADHVRLDKYHLIRAFRAELGAPPYEYLTHARIHRARELLRAGCPPATVAPAVGYYDQSQLHRHFLKIVGTTPGKYARSTRRERWPSAPPLLREASAAVPKGF